MSHNQWGQPWPPQDEAVRGSGVSQHNSGAGLPANIPVPESRPGETPQQTAASEARAAIIEAEIAKGGGSLVNSITFWNAKPLPGTIVDPYKESARLNSNAATGKPLTTGDTPIIVPREKGLLEGLVPNF